MIEVVESTYNKRQTEMMICMKEQGYCLTLDGKKISFPLHFMMRMWDILKQDANRTQAKRMKNERKI